MPPKTGPSSATLEALFSDLSLASNSNDHSEVVKVSNRILAHQSQNLDALKAKVIALIKLDEYENAMELLGKLPETEATLERAYCYYKTGKEVEAAGLTKDSEDRAMQHVAAQTAYRLEDFDRAAQLYATLSSGRALVPNEDVDLKVNHRAAVAQSFWSIGAATAPSNSNDNPIYEAAYNSACIKIAQGEYAEANTLLEHAARECEAMEGWAQADLDAELAPIWVQLAYVHQKLGQIPQAMELYKQVLEKGGLDSSVKAVARHNSVTIDEPRNPYLSARMVAGTKAKDVASRLFAFQTQVITRNQAISELQAGKYKAARSLAARSPDDLTLSLVAAAAIAAEVGGDSKKFNHEVEKVLEKQPTNTALVLALVQNKMQKADTHGAVQAMEKLFAALADKPAHKYKPGLVGLMVKLYELQGRREKILEVLASAAEYWKSQPESAAWASISRANALAKLTRSGSDADIQSAADDFEALVKRDPTDQQALAGLVAAYSSFNPDAATQYAEQLTPIEDLVDGIDVDALEAAGVPTQTPPTKKRTAPSEPTTTKPKKSRRKPLLPKNVVEGQQPDPERWIPLRDRSTYKPPKNGKDKKGKGKVALAGGTQGGVVDESLEMSATVAGKDQGVVVGGEKKASGGANKKKKKGGKR
ncbi:Signal recognition particle subunit SRP72 [Saitoella coloradoensis]